MRNPGRYPEGSFVQVSYGNSPAGVQFHAEYCDANGKSLAYGADKFLSTALRELACAVEDMYERE